MTALLQLFTRQLAHTTNDIAATKKRAVYRLLAHYLSVGVTPDDLTVVTFNQDLQVEKCLQLMSATPKWVRHQKELFSFPGCYCIGPHDVTAPTGSSTSPLFEESVDVDAHVRVLKLHGSLNWYSTHLSQRPSPTAMFKHDRQLWITRRIRIDPQMALSRSVQRARTLYTLPVVVPPVTHKSAVLHDDLKAVWREAETRLKGADEIVIFGYSCPALDFEAANLLRRSLTGREVTVVVIDPAASVATRYIELLKPSELKYYPSFQQYLEHC